MTRQQSAKPSRNDNRKFAVSANRSDSRHRVRYVESGGAGVDLEECVFCESAPSLRMDDHQLPE